MNKGFTLVELLGVLTILAIISAISVVVINNIVLKSKKDLTDIQKKSIEDTAKIYYIKEGMNEDVTCVNVSFLLEKGYFEGREVVDIENNKKAMDGSVKIIYEANQYSYEYQDTICE